MPERDSDRIIYEKLKDYKADYNSADWEQMEGMLPQKSRTPYYAVAALLLLLLGVAGLWVGTGSSQQESVTAQKENAAESKDVITSHKNEQINQRTTDAKAVETTDQAQRVVASESSEKNAASLEKNISPVIEEQVTHEKIFEKNDN